MHFNIIQQKSIKHKNIRKSGLSFYSKRRDFDENIINIIKLKKNLKIITSIGKWNS